MIRLARTTRHWTLCCSTFACLVVLFAADLMSHEPRQPVVLVSASSNEGLTADETADLLRRHGTCRLTIRATQGDTPVHSWVRFRDSESGKFLTFSGEIERLPGKMADVAFWYPVTPGQTLEVPRRTLNVEAFRGLTTRRWQQKVDLAERESSTLPIALQPFYDLSQQHPPVKSGNTHLHLMRMTHREAIRYLQIVPRADDLDLVYLSHLRRIPDEQHYISNQIVEDGLQTSPDRMVPNGVLFGIGEEHRHNFGRGGEGFGHVMLLDIARLIQPVSIGPGIMGSGHDSVSLNRGIRQAHGDGATVIWCHNGFGLEDHANHLLGHTDALNIFDGGSRGSYAETHYRYYDLSVQLPMSTGTDWFIYDLSRVHVPVLGELTSKSWLSAVRKGKSTITNGPLLEFSIADASLGETIALDEPATLTVRCRAVARSDFGKLELIQNGEVIRSFPSQARDGLFQVDASWQQPVQEASWFALRVAPDKQRTNILGQPLFAHTSPIYVQMKGRDRFVESVAQELLAEIRGGVTTIEMKANFADETQKQRVLKIYRDAAEHLRSRIVANREVAAAPR